MSDYPGAFGTKENRRATCPECGKVTNVDTLLEKLVRWHQPGPEIDGIEEYYVFQCRGCDTIFFAKSTGNSEDYSEGYNPGTGEPELIYHDHKQLWPSAPKSPAPLWAGFDLSSRDETLYDLLHSVYKALNEEMNVLAAVGMRTSFDRVSFLLGVGAELPFANKLDELRKRGYISEVQKGLLEVLVDAGNAAAHRGWKPEWRHLATMRDILEALIRDQFILKAEVEKLRLTIPAREKKP